MPNVKLLQSDDIDKYNVRLHLDNPGSENQRTWAWTIIYSCNQTRLETLEYDNEGEARRDFRLICSVIKNVLACEKNK